MALDPVLVQQFRAREAELRMRGELGNDDGWQVLQSVEQVLGFLYHSARTAWGCSEDEACDLIELCLLDVGLSRGELRAAAKLLRALHYHAVSDRLIEIAKASPTRKPSRKTRRRSKSGPRPGPVRAPKASGRIGSQMAVALFRKH